MFIIIWIDPIFDRTQADVDFARAHKNDDEQYKGAQGYIHWARLTNNIYYVADKLTSRGFAVTATCKNDWDIYTIPTQSDIEGIKNDMLKIREVFSGATGVPNVPYLPYTHYEKINDMEKILYDFYELADKISIDYMYSGEIYSGERELFL